jgi:hypothetical protein
LPEPCLLLSSRVIRCFSVRRFRTSSRKVASVADEAAPTAWPIELLVMGEGWTGTLLDVAGVVCVTAG